VKLDIEGTEYNILQDVLAMGRDVHTWIIEVHPIGNPHPNTIIETLIEAGFEISWVNRQTNTVEPYLLDTNWEIHSTIFARR
jgi:hypothetical protein